MEKQYLISNKNLFLRSIKTDVSLSGLKRENGDKAQFTNQSQN